jgi:hypothetical protein
MKDETLRERAAVAVFAALAGRPDFTPEAEAGAAALSWRLADVFLEARRGSLIARCLDVLREFEGTEALERLLRLDGTEEKCIGDVMSYYENKPDPLRAFAESPARPRTPGMTAAARFLEKQRG